jgi:alpha-glucosidase (family GH31 glycosyl hydrolase)
MGMRSPGTTFLAGLLPIMLLASPLSCPARTSTAAAGDARFEFLTSSLVRLEYSPSRHFVDAPTAVVQKREWPPVAFSRSIVSGWLVVSTSGMTLRYKLKSGAFAAGNLEIEWKDGGKSHSWRPGQVDDRNLGGLTYSLDNISKPNLPTDGKDLASPVNDIIPGIDVLLPSARPGLLSRNGYAFIDDSATPVWNAAAQWIEPRDAKGSQDWYLFAYGRDYRKVLAEYAQLCGAIPMIPRYVLGPWITDLNFEYFPGSAQTQTAAFRHYGQQHLEDEVARLRDDHIPLDVLVLDFAWHNYGWQGGFDWSPLIPHSKQLLDWLHARGVKVGLNDHPGYAHTRESILSHDDSHAPEVLKALGEPMPPKPSFNLDLSNGWLFATDPHDVGVKANWFATDFDDRKWKHERPGASPARSDGKDYVGITWYRERVHLPSRLPPHLYLYLGRQARDYRLYIDGRQVEHTHVRWPRRLTWADVTPYVKPGQTIEIALRMQPNEYGSGFLIGTTAIRDVKPPHRIYLDLSNKQQAQISMRDLHGPLMKQGVDIWWVDGGSGATTMPGLDPQFWTNRVFYDDSQRESGRRAFILARYGGWGSERYPGYFTGDTYSEWPVLSYEVAYSVRGGNVLIPYISHDIGGFHGGKIPFDLYARWVEFGAFSPLLRLHSAHENPEQGNRRMPWTYGRRGIDLVRKYFTLHTQLIPYVYTFAWIAYEQSLPLMRPLYLEDPASGAAYQHPHEYWYGDQMLVAPVLDADGRRAVWLPPGQWFDFFSGKSYRGGTSFTAHYATDQAPVFARNGAIIPEQPADFAWSDQKPLDHLIVNVYGTGDGAFDLYQDDGSSLAYRQHWYALTPMRYGAQAGGVHRLVIGPAKGAFKGQVQRRAYEVRVHGITRPASVTLDGVVDPRWTWDAANKTATVPVPAHSTRRRITVGWRAAEN